MNNLETTDFLVVGGGVIGLRIAIEARRRHPDARVTLIEKETALGRHASGRNSGVLHAGFYYTADSFKARFTKIGCERLSEYCVERGLRINRCGKLVVAKSASELGVLDELLQRGRRNGVKLEEIGAAEAREIEPRVRTHERALFSPSTATVDPLEVVEAFASEAKADGVRIRTGETYVARSADGVLTDKGRIAAGYVVNCAGLHADVVARQFGFSERLRILPFKGLYLYAKPGSCSLRTNIYPVPDLATPFLGVHFTVAVDGRVKIGPTAVPAFWREQYRLVDNFKLGEFLEVARLESFMFLRNKGKFRTIALREITKYYRPRLVRLASQLAAGVSPSDFTIWGEPGIRAQLVDRQEYRLHDDFVLEGDERSLHILNAVSPAFTCAIPFAAFALDTIAELTG
jgi:L-2-hydroxyglutarate oxidase LhgO